MATRALAIGSSGFIGGCVCEGLVAEGFEVVGVDNINLSKPNQWKLFMRHFGILAFLARARPRGLPAGRMQFVLARFKEVSLPGGFDSVVGSSVLHHLGLDDALVAISRLLKPGACSISPNRTCSTRRSSSSGVVRFTLTRTLEQAGFENVRITPFDCLPGAREFSGSLHIRGQSPLAK